MGCTWWNLCNYVQAALVTGSILAPALPCSHTGLTHAGPFGLGCHAGIGCHGNGQEATKDLRVSQRWRSSKATAQEGQDKEKPICLLSLNTNSPPPLCKEMLMNWVLPWFKKPSAFQPNATKPCGWSILPSAPRSIPSVSALWGNDPKANPEKVEFNKQSLCHCTTAPAADKFLCFQKEFFLLLHH